MDPAARAHQLRERIDAALAEVEASPFYAGLVRILEGAAAGPCGASPAAATGQVSGAVDRPRAIAGVGAHGCPCAPPCWWFPVDDLVVYGLGPLATSPSARSQLALALLLARRLGEPPAGTGAESEAPSASGAGVPSPPAPPGGVAGIPAASPLPLRRPRLRAYDPAFGPLDVAELESRGFQVMTSDELELGTWEGGGGGSPASPATPPEGDGCIPARGARDGGGPRRTLFYMPHCEAGLYDRLIRQRGGDAHQVRNIVLPEGGEGAHALLNMLCIPLRVKRRKGMLKWMPSASAPLFSARPHQLSAMAVLGNSFARYSERWDLAGGRTQGLLPGARAAGPAPGAAAAKGERPEALLAAARVTREAAVPEADFPVVSAFNDLSLHTFPRTPPSARCLANGINS